MIDYNINEYELAQWIVDTYEYYESLPRLYINGECIVISSNFLCILE